MKDILRHVLTLALGSALFAAPGLAIPQSQDPSQDPKTQQPPQPQTQQQSGPQPVQQKDTVNPKNSKEDVEAIGNRGVGKGVNFYSLEREIALGKQLAQEVERSSKLIDDPIVVEYVNRVGQNLVRNSDARVPFTIKVIDSDVVNAFALPGGFFYVNSGLVLRANEESELAGVMAHEISHVTARHGTKQANKGELIQLASIPAMIFIPYSLAGYGIYQGMNLAIPLTFLKFSRDAEREADFLGLQYMYKAGYDPNSYITFFERIQADEKRRPGTIPKVFSTHPPGQAGIYRHHLGIRLRQGPPPQHHVLAQDPGQSARQTLSAHQDRAVQEAAYGQRSQQHRRRPPHPQAPPRYAALICSGGALDAFFFSTGRPIGRPFSLVLQRGSH